MKNKHLVLMFLAVFMLGLVGRYCHFNSGNQLDALLFKNNIAEIERISISSAQDTLALSGHMGQWVMEQNGETATLPDSVVQRLFQCIAQLKTTQLLHSDRPDTLGLKPHQRITLSLFSKKWPEQVFFIGKTTSITGQKATWITLPNHDQYYLVPGDVRQAMYINTILLSPPVAMLTDTTGLAAIEFLMHKDTLIQVVTDAAGVRWNHLNAAADTLLNTRVEHWKKNWIRVVQQAQPAYFFDKRSASETFCGEIRFKYQQMPDNPVQYRLFFIRRPVLPDDPEKRRYFRNFKPQYLFESDLQPGLYFAITDTLAIHSLKNL